MHSLHQAPQLPRTLTNPGKSAGPTRTPSRVLACAPKDRCRLDVIHSFLYYFQWCSWSREKLGIASFCFKTKEVARPAMRANKNHFSLF
jgi:hypothetical protein